MSMTTSAPQAMESSFAKLKSTPPTYRSLSWSAIWVEFSGDEASLSLSLLNCHGKSSHSTNRSFNISCSLLRSKPQDHPQLCPSLHVGTNKSNSGFTLACIPSFDLPVLHPTDWTLTKCANPSLGVLKQQLGPLQFQFNKSFNICCSLLRSKPQGILSFLPSLKVETSRSILQIQSKAISVTSLLHTSLPSIHLSYTWLIKDAIPTPGSSSKTISDMSSFNSWYKLTHLHSAQKQSKKHTQIFHLLRLEQTAPL